MTPPDAPPPSAALLTAGAAPPPWAAGLVASERVRIVPFEAADPRLGEALEDVGVALVDAALEAPLSVARRVHRLVPALQIVIVSPGERLEALRRSALFTPGLGEPWLLSPEEVTPALLRRAADVARQRRGHARRLKQVAAEVEALSAPSALSPILSDRYLATLLELLPDPVLALDERDRVVFANPAASGALELGPVAPGRGPRLGEVLRAGRPGLLEGLLEAARHEVVRRQLELEPVAGGARTYEVVLAPVQGERPLLAVLLHDVTDRVEVQDRLEEQAAELEVQAEDLRAQAEERERLLEERDRALGELRDLIRQRSRFYAGMSHELRTPINAIIGYNELLLGEVFGALPEPHRDPLERANRAARHLLELVSDILDLSKLEAGKLEVEAQLVDASELVSDLTATMEPLAQGTGVDLRFDVDASCDRPFRTDPRRLRQVLMNLLSNAIRHGRGAAVDVRCRLEGEALEVDVQDRGPGIPPEELETIFDEFVQLQGGEAGGTGLGLSISRALVRALGGELTVRSEVGRGSTFTVRVPQLSSE